MNVPAGFLRALALLVACAGVRVAQQDAEPLEALAQRVKRFLEEEPG